MLIRTPWKRIILICVRGRYKIGWEETKHWPNVENTHERRWSGRTDIIPWYVLLGCIQRECQISNDIVVNYRDIFESRISAGAKEKHLVSATSDANISSWFPVDTNDVVNGLETMERKIKEFERHAAKAAVDKEWEKLEKISAWNLTKVRSKKEVIDEARMSGAKVHFASLMDICHLKNAELEAKHQKYKGRVVLCGDIVKDNSGAYAVFTEQGSSASQMTPAKIMDIISRLPGCDGQAADAVSAHTQVKKEDAPKLLKILKSECPDIWIRLPRHKWPKSWSSMEDPVVPLERNLYGHPLAGLLWERQFEKIPLKHGWEKIPNWECLFVNREKGLFLSVYVDDIKLAGKKQNLDPMWKLLNKEFDLGEPTSFLDHVYLGCTQRQCEISKNVVDNYRNMFESRISVGATEKLPCSENLSISSWSYDMEGHAEKCVERYCELANETTQQFVQSRNTTHGWPSIERKRKWISRTIIHSLLTNCSEMSIFGSFWESWHFLVCEQTCACNQQMDEILWHTIMSFDFLHSSYKWIQAIVFCGQHSTTMQTRIVSRLWFCKRPWRLKINIKRNSMHFRKPNICANQLDVQEKNLSFTQFYGSWGSFSWCKFTHGWDSRSQSLGFGNSSISFLTNQNRQNQRW